MVPRRYPSYTMEKEPIAIVGIAAELPSGSYAETNLDFKQFTNFLLDQGDAYEEVPLSRFNAEAWTGDTLGRVNATKGTFLKDVGMFDALEFGISAKDARAMALSTRKLIELSFLALLDAGIEYRGRNVGTFATGITHDIFSVAEPDVLEAKGSFAGIPCMIANKISYHLDLRGPSIPVDTACSSSLTALHLAVQALRASECESAVVAGCQLNMRLVDFVNYSQASVLASDGKCKPLDAEADGFSRGEGAVAVVLKPYKDALRDGDHVYAKVLGTGVNASGSLAPVYAPVASAQADAMHRAYEGINRDPKDVDFIELHATGTSVGDPVESNWVGAVFARDSELVIGSVKGNIGHLESTAFLASLCKVCGIFETRTIPPTINHKSRNPAIKWDEYKLQLPLKPMPIGARSSTGDLLVSILSSGIGGANGHLVVESFSHARTVKECAVPASGPVLFIAGGLTPRSSSDVASGLSHMAEKYPDHWASLSTTYGRRGRQMTWRTYVVAQPAHDGDVSLRFPPPVAAPRSKPPLVFLFSGQGPQHINMGRQLFRRYPIFQQTVLELDACHRTVTGVSLIEEFGLFIDDPSLHSLPSIWPISAILPSLAMVQMALFDLLCSLGLTPDVLIGHSAGETPLLYASGAGPKAMAMEIAIARGQAMTLVEASSGGMASLACSAEEAQMIIGDVCNAIPTEGVMEIACFNSPNAVALAGHLFLIDKAVELANSRGIFARKLQTGVAVHSSLMDICQEKYRTLISGIFDRYPGSHRPNVLTYSTATGHPLECFSEEYFWLNSRNPVRFTHAIHELLQEHNDASFFEISPHPVLSSYLHEMGVSPNYLISPMRRSKQMVEHQEEKNLLESLGRSMMIGHTLLDFRALNGENAHLNHRLGLPPYPFTKRHIAYLPDHSQIVERQFATRKGPLCGTDLRMNALTHPDLAEHVINHEPIMAATGFLEMVLELGAKSLWNVRFLSILSLSAENPVPVVVERTRTHWRVISKAMKHNSSNENTTRLHADGYMSSDPVESTNRVELEAIRDRCESRPMQSFYQRMEPFAQYGPLFRRISKFWLGLNESLTEIRGTDEDMPKFNKYIIHPAILDACCHVIVHPDFTANTDSNVYYLPSRVGMFMIHDSLSSGTFPKTVFAHAVLKEWLPDELVTDICVVDTTGTKICTFYDFSVERHYHAIPRPVTKRYDLVYQPFAVSPSIVASDIARGLLYDNGSSVCCMDPGKPGNDLKPLAHQKPSPSSTAAVDRLILMLRGLLKHILENSRKKTIRILALKHGAEAEQLNREICALLESSDSTAVFVVTTDVENISEEPLPSIWRSVPLDVFESVDDLIPESSFDIIIGLYGLPAHGLLSRYLRRLHSLLLPGGFLLLAEPTNRTLDGQSHQDVTRLTELWTTQLCSIGFSTTAHLNTGDDGQLVFLEAQRSSAITLIGPATLREELLIVAYVVGREMDIQQALLNLDPHTKEIWFAAEDGVAADGARGFTRSLRRELPDLTIGLVCFTFQCTFDEQARIIRHLSVIPGMELEVLVDDDCQVFVPRIYPCPSPAPSREGPPVGTIQNQLSPSFVAVTIMQSVQEAGFCGIVGRVTQVGSDVDSIWLNRVVATIPRENAELVAGRAVVHIDSVAPLDDGVDLRLVARLLPALLISGMALGIELIKNSLRRHAGRVIVTHDETELGKALVWFINALGLQALGLSSNASAFQWFSLRLRYGDIVITGHDPCDTRLDGFLVDGALVFYWTSRRQLDYSLTSCPWLISDILKSAISKVAEISAVTYPVALLDDVPSPSAFTPSSLTMFKSSEVYLLVGGIGSLGLHIALWMYEKGARYIVLTSRHGQDSLTLAKNILALRMLAYLKSRTDLSLQLIASDATLLPSLRDLLAGIKRPIAGCMLLSVVLSDRMFLSHDAASFSSPFAPKLDAFKNIESALPIKKLDFLITFSSMVTLGNTGQTNYTSANTILEGETSKYANAFCVLAPIITDTSVVGGEQNFDRLLSWGMSARDVCHCLEDGIRLLAERRFTRYIPDLNFTLISKLLGSSSLYDHLVQQAESIPTSTPSSGSLRDIVLSFLDVNPSDFCIDLPLTAYGIDSLSAGRISFALRPFLTISQVQLLGQISLSDLQSLAELKQCSRGPSDGDQKIQRTVPTEIKLETPIGMQRPSTLIKLTDRGGIPLILIHGGSGRITSFVFLQQKFTTSLWALQITPDAPLQSIGTLARYYVSQIKGAQREGPYRLGMYSGTSVLGLAMVKLLESSGDEVMQCYLLDHFPLLFASPWLELDNETMQLRSPGTNFKRRAVDMLAFVAKNESPQTLQVLAQEYKDAAGNIQSPGGSLDWVSAFEKIAIITYEFIFDLLPPGQVCSVPALRQALVDWMRTIRAPITVLISSRGVILAIPEPERPKWEDLGVRQTYPNARIVAVDSTHYGLFESPTVLEILEEDART